MPIQELEQARKQASAVLNACLTTGAKLQLLEEQRKATLEQRQSVQEQLDQKKLMEELFLFLLERAQKRAVGMFEKLLTSMLQDVVPSEGQAVQLQLSMERGSRPGLHFGVRNRAGYVHSITHGTGGSISNIVAAGARMIALYRASGHLRPFLVFDEADHWIEPHRVGAFYSIMRDMSQMLGLQTLVISHSALTNIFPDGVPKDVQVLKLHREQFADIQEDYSWIEPVLTEENEGLDPNRKGLRSLRLRDYRAHRDSLCPLAEGMNFLVGTNNGGKSNITEALKCIVQGAPEDGVIRDGRDSCVVSLETEDGTLHWTRKRAGSPKERYQWAPHLHSSTEPRDEAAKFGPPDWVLRVLRMGKLDNMSLQISEQKGKTFLLDETASRRAEILSVGQASSMVYTLIEDHQALVKVNQERLRALDKQLADNLAMRQALIQMGLDPQGLQDRADSLRRLIEELDRRMEQERRMQTALAALRTMHALRHALQTLTENVPPQALDAFAQSLEAAEAHQKRSVEMNQALVRLTRLDIARRARAALPDLGPELVPELTSARMISAGKQVARMKKLREQLGALRAIDTTGLDRTLQELGQQAQSHQRWFEVAHSLEVLRQAAQSAGKDLAACDEDLRKNGQALSEVQARLGDLCPMCGQSLQQPHAHADAAPHEETDHVS